MPRRGVLCDHRATREGPIDQPERTAADREDARSAWRPRPDALGFTRSHRDRVVAGVAGGLGERLGVDPMFVRIGFVALTFAGGAGILLYLLGWAVTAESDADGAPTPVRAPDLRQTVALGLILLGVMLLLRQAGLWLGDRLVWPILLAAFGSAVLWTRGSADDRARWTEMAARIPGNPVAAVLGGRVSLARVLIGGLLIALGMGGFLAVNDGLAALGDVMLAVAVTIAGAALAFGPWIWRLVEQLATERRERIRSEERAEVAAHLHDSVLQTLAMIQRATDDPRRMVSLARRQERELRAWLYGRRVEPGGPEALRGLVDAMAEDVEASHHVSVEVVVVGDAPVDAQVRALVAAAREATVNAARHAGVGRVSVFVEATPGQVAAFVRDRGRGFDPTRVPEDRRGLADSVVGRMQRHGGTVEILSDDQGTEVGLWVPLNGQRERQGEP